MVPAWNYFILMQIDYPRLPPGAATKNSINTKMTIFQEPLVDNDPSLCQNVSFMKPFWLDLWQIYAEHENVISITT